MRITFVTSAVDFSGGTRVISQYAEGLRRKGHEVLVVSPPPYPYGRLARARNFLYPPRLPRVESHFDGTQVAVKHLERHRAVRDSDVPEADVVIATWWETAEWVAKFRRNRGRKFHFVQDYEVWNGDTERVDACLRHPMKKITISRWLESILVNRFGASNVIVVPNGVNGELFPLRSREPPAPSKVGFVYASHPRKGADIALAAIAQARATDTSLRGIAFGHNADVSSDLKRGDFLDYRRSPAQRELCSIYGSCSAWLFPSREEGFGLPILEALACGTPVVATPAGAAPEILSKGGGVLLSSFEAEEMAIAICRLSRLGPAEWSELSHQARQTAESFALQKSIDLFEQQLLLPS
jgi:glycosyltransferase involved in cell wall biosynthesis